METLDKKHGIVDTSLLNLDDFEDPELLDLRPDPPEEQEYDPDIEDEDEGDEEDAPAPRSKKPLIISLGIVVALALCCFGGAMALLAQGGAFNQEIFFRNTYINGVDCGGLTVERAAGYLTQASEEYTLTINQRNGVTETINASALGMQSLPDTEEMTQLLAEQKAGIDLLSQYFTRVDYTVASYEEYDETQLQAAIDALNCLNAAYMEPPQNASIQVSADGTYELSPAVMGTTLDRDAARAAIQTALESGEESIDLEALGLYTSPAILDDDPQLTTELTQLQTFTGAEITYDFSDRTIVCDRTVIVSLLVQDESGNWSVDAAKAEEWVKTALAYKTDTFGLTHTFETTNGETVTLEGGDYGWCINRPRTAEALVASIESGAVETVEPIYKYSGICRDTNDIGDSYVEISIADQTLWCYKDGVCVVETPIVTGSVANETETPSGSVWAIDAKKSPATLGTLDTMGYSSDVNYWMPFTGDVGMHDADGWRSNYGGTIYLTNGSHGCVNMPLEAAETVYKNVVIGTPVVVY